MIIMQEDEARNVTARGEVGRRLNQSRLAVRCIFALCALLSGFSALAFLFQVLHKDEFGGMFRDQPGAWPHVLGHVLRTAVGAALAWCLWRYLKAVKKSIHAGQDETPELFRALARWWNCLAICGLALVLYGVWVAFVTGPPLLIRPLSPRFQAEPLDKSAVKVEFRLAEANPGEGLIEATVVGGSRTVFLHREPFLTNQDIAEARVVLNERDEPSVEVRFVLAAQQKIRDATEAHRGKPLAILVDGRVVTAPIVEWRFGESAWIQGSFTRQEATRIATGLSGRE
jgi:hypothetical protein